MFFLGPPQGKMWGIIKSLYIGYHLFPEKESNFLHSKRPFFGLNTGYKGKERRLA